MLIIREFMACADLVLSCRELSRRPNYFFELSCEYDPPTTKLDIFKLQGDYSDGSERVGIASMPISAGAIGTGCIEPSNG